MFNFYEIAQAADDTIEELEIPETKEAIFEFMLEALTYDEADVVPFRRNVDRMIWGQHYRMSRDGQDYRLVLDLGGTWVLFRETFEDEREYA